MIRLRQVVGTAVLLATWPALAQTALPVHLIVGDITAPALRLSWSLESLGAVRGVRQLGYEIRVATSPQLLAAKPNLWSSDTIFLYALSVPRFLLGWHTRLLKCKRQICRHSSSVSVAVGDAKDEVMIKQEYRHLRVGLVGLGLEAYWEQFAGLKERLSGYVNDVALMMKGPDRVILNLGLVDSPASALDAGHQCRLQDIDLLMVYATTYALSSTVLPIITRAKVPVILLDLQPAAAIDYHRFNGMKSRTEMTGEWLAYCGSCPVPEIANVLVRLGIGFHQITGMLHGDPHVRQDLDSWLRAAGVAKSLAHSRLGLLGHYYGGMLDIATDLAQVSGRFGIHVEQLEVEELAQLRREASEAEIHAKTLEIERFFEVEDACLREEIRRAAQTAVALDSLVRRNNLDMMAYYHKGIGIPESENVMSSIIVGASMLTASGVPVAGEYEIKNVIAMKIMDLLGAGGSFTEFYAMDFEANVILMGHDGPGHVGIADERIKLCPLQVYHGKVGSGLSVEMSVKHGPVTLLSIVENDKTGMMLLVAEGASVSGEVLEIGNTNSRYSFPLDARNFAESWNSHGPAHHCAIGVGHLGGVLQKIATLLNIEFQKVC